jgi:hypothetical protein
MLMRNFIEKLRQLSRFVLMGSVIAVLLIALTTFHPSRVHAATAPYFGWVNGWGNGSIVSAVQPGTSLPCDAAHVCEKTAQGASDAVTQFGAGGTVGAGTLEAVLDTDLPNATSNGAGGGCYPVTGQLAITPTGGVLVLKVQGSDCVLGTETTLQVITGSYFIDPAKSSGKYAGVSGVGAFHWSADSSVSPAQVRFKLTGNLHFS